MSSTDLRGSHCLPTPVPHVAVNVQLPVHCCSCRQSFDQHQSSALDDSDKRMTAYVRLGDGQHEKLSIPYV